MKDENVQPFAAAPDRSIKSLKDLALSEETVPMTFKYPVVLTMQDLTRIEFPAGTQEVPVSLKNHWYLKANKVTFYDPNAKKVEAPAPPEPPKAELSAKEAFAAVQALVVDGLDAEDAMDAVQEFGIEGAQNKWKVEKARRQKAAADKAKRDAEANSKNQTGGATAPQQQQAQGGDKPKDPSAKDLDKISEEEKAKQQTSGDPNKK